MELQATVPRKSRGARLSGPPIHRYVVKPSVIQHTATVSAFLAAMAEAQGRSSSPNTATLSL